MGVQTLDPDGTLANSVILFLLFSAHLFEGTTQIVFVCVTYILWGMTYTIMDIPSGRWSSNHHAR